MNKTANYAVIDEKVISLYDRISGHYPALEDLYKDVSIEIVDGVLLFKGTEIQFVLTGGFCPTWKESGKGRHVRLTFGSGWILREEG